MFDWDEEELSNIIWGEAGEADDHIVPYTEGSDERPRGLYDHIKKEWNHEGTNTKPAEQKKCVAKNNYTGGKQEGSSQNDTIGGVPVAGYSMDRWPNLSLSHAAETDQDSMGTDSLTEITKYNSSRGDETYQVDNGSQIFQKQHEERDQQTQIQGRVYSQYQHSPNSFVAPSVCGSNKIQNYTRTSLPQIYSREDNQPVLSGYNISPSNINPSSRSLGTSLKSLTMTPQEKIKKLRRHQQMQALLAIQKQQQQLNHQVSNNDHSVEKKCLHENQIQLIQEGNIKVEEIVCSLPSIDPNSPIEQDDSNTVSMIVDENYYVEETILHRLEDIIAKLDIRIRLCIRDSLFRLAQSTKHRHYASDTSITNKNSRDELEVLAKETSSDHSFTRMPDMETETNPIDRTVAHLLFHRPAELSGKHPETPESPVVSTKLPSERNTSGLLSLPRGFFPDNYKSKHNLSYTAGSKNPHLFAEGDHSKNSSCIDTSENASNNEAADAGCMEIELSQ
ncbi:hypothetical protein ACSBR2_017737 [Camellia fascicularis]